MSKVDIFENRFNLEIKQLSQHICHQNWYWDSRVTWSGSDEYVIWIVDSGTGKLKCGENSFLLNRGDVYVLPLNSTTSYYATHDPKNPLTFFWIDFFIEEENRTVTLSEDELAPFYCKSVNLNMLQTIFKRIEKVSQKEKKVWLKTLISEIGYQYSFEKDNPGMQLIMDLCDVLKANPGKYRSIDQIPTNKHYSKEHLIRLFKKYKNSTPHEYMIKNRINTAMRLLKTSSLTIREISSELGYSDLFSFSKQFKSITGQTPTGFRKS
ncbi:MAG: AraC family transcriptional regulator [Spirochaetaceae bacterium]